ncbi:DEKNAAC102318 [Brettanomyces naardenensis]|uniref:DEKNAAC102318 n=1 Tax=Brettanomyces naardenensis TaxID=13370 RepID=A0A448YK31_BRENA|nr:DEKNAAC102318 [Brettanomyces naardenensis]
MSAFSDKAFDANQYSSFRPTYPPDFYEKIVDFHAKGKDGQFGTLLDLGCGPGEASIPLLGYFKDEVIATDISSAMIKTAKTNFANALEDLRKKKKEGKKVQIPKKVTLELSAGEDLSKVDSGSIDLVVAAECVHWFQWDKWLTEMVRILKDNGSLIYFAYCDPVFVGEPKANEIYEKFVYQNGDYLGPYWEQPGRSRLRKLVKELNDKVLNDDRFEDVKVRYYNPLGEDSSRDDKMLISRIYSVADFIKYVNTWSSSHKWNATHPDDAEDAGELFFGKLSKELNWTRETQIHITWKTVYVFARKHAD